VESVAAVANFVDSSKTVASAGVPLTGSVAPAVFNGESRSPDTDCPEKVGSFASGTPNEVELTLQKPRTNITTPGQDALGGNARSIMHAGDTARTVTAETQVLADTNIA